MKKASKKRNWQKAFLVSLFSTLMLNSYLAMFLIYPIYLQIIGIDPLQIGMLMSLFYIANMMIRPYG